MRDVNGTPIREGSYIRKADDHDRSVAQVRDLDEALDIADLHYPDGYVSTVAGWMAEQFWEVVA